jgi:hypothetical protein
MDLGTEGSGQPDCLRNRTARVAVAEPSVPTTIDSLISPSPRADFYHGHLRAVSSCGNRSAE